LKEDRVQMIVVLKWGDAFICLYRIYLFHHVLFVLQKKMKKKQKNKKKTKNEKKRKKKGKNRIKNNENASKSLFICL
jgi:hypothetical protein